MSYFNTKDLFKSYLETALWSSVDLDGKNLDDTYSIYDFKLSFIKKQYKEFKSFLKQIENLNLIDDQDDINHVGHDFWLTRNRHGAGFWDGDYVNGDKLTEISQKYSEIDLYFELY